VNISKILIFLIVFLAAQSASAQLCTGSLGDPIVNINFGVGSNPGAPLSAATTNYQYNSGDCPNDGFYTVRTNTSGCFGSTWHNVNSDHTGNANGYFMLINASIQPSAFYLDTVRSLCGNTTYEFAAWIMNVIVPSACSGSSIQPNITFSIERTDGTVLQTYNTNNIPVTPSPQWKQFGFFFTTPAGVTDVVLRMTNNSTGGCGNDLALDDITFRPCGPLLTPSVAGNSNVISFCEGQAHAYVFNCTASAGFTNPTFQWQQSSDGINYTDISGAVSSSYAKSFAATDPAGTYYYRCSAAETGNIASVQCRVSSTSIKVTINAKPTATAGSNTPACQNNTLSLTATGGSSYQWSGPGGFSSADAAPQILNVQPAAGGTYNVTATNAAGCSGGASTAVVINPAPNATVLFTDSTICFEKTVKLSAAGGGTYTWSPAASLSVDNVAEPLASPMDTTRYRVVVTNSFNCTDTAYTTINVIVKPVVNAGEDRTLIKGNSIQLSGTISGNVVSYFWSPNTSINNVNVLNPVVNPDADIDYTLTAVAGGNCGVVTDVISVSVFTGLYIPNAFTPNGDSKNDTWNVPALAAFPKAQLIVFNRYGEKVFEGTGAQNTGWDGRFKNKNLPAGNYVYVINLNDGSPVIRGSVLLLR
jgi:gliding motility-associated-like protein